MPKPWGGNTLGWCRYSSLRREENDEFRESTGDRFIRWVLVIIRILIFYLEWGGKPRFEKRSDAIWLPLKGDRWGCRGGRVDLRVLEQRFKEIAHMEHLIQSLMRAFFLDNFYAFFLLECNCFTPWRREWQHTQVFWPGEFHGQRSQVGCGPQGRKESDTTEWLTLSHFQLLYNVVSISAVQWSESAIYMHISAPFWTSVISNALVRSSCYHKTPQTRWLI